MCKYLIAICSLQAGDEILSINGLYIADSTHGEVVNILRSRKNLLLKVRSKYLNFPFFFLSGFAKYGVDLMVLSVSDEYFVFHLQPQEKYRVKCKFCLFV